MWVLSWGPELAALMQLRASQNGKKGQKTVSIEEIFEALVAKMAAVRQCAREMIPDIWTVRMHFCDNCLRNLC